MFDTSQPVHGDLVLAMHGARFHLTLKSLLLLVELTDPAADYVLFLVDLLAVGVEVVHQVLVLGTVHENY